MSMGRVEGKVAFITGAARGQGRGHAVRLAEEGADIIVVDVCAAVTETAYPAATVEDLDETVRAVEKLGRRVVARRVDVRDLDGLEAAVQEGVAELGSLDVVVANAGICTWGRFWEMSAEVWQTMIDVNLTGVWHTLKVSAPIMIEQGRGGSMITISSVAGLKSLPAQGHYAAAKHGIVGLTKTAALELGPYRIRVNSIHPWGVDTPMIQDRTIETLLVDHPSYAASFGQVLTEPTVADPRDISDAVLWLASDASRMVTGIQLPVDAGATKV
jgi:SDR family mycofactocin-dependent oxidoreductase